VPREHAPGPPSPRPAGAIGGPPPRRQRLLGRRGVRRTSVSVPAFAKSSLRTPPSAPPRPVSVADVQRQTLVPAVGDGTAYEPVCGSPKPVLCSSAPVIR